jgi:hypothetical protein
MHAQMRPAQIVCLKKQITPKSFNHRLLNQRIEPLKKNTFPVRIESV